MDSKIYVFNVQTNMFGNKVHACESLVVILRFLLAMTLCRTSARRHVHCTMLKALLIKVQLSGSYELDPNVKNAFIHSLIVLEDKVKRPLDF